MLEERGFHVLRHHLLPPNDGGISLGQAVAAMRSLQKGE
jgi:hydrogenase maturation protein HypF